MESAFIMRFSNAEKFGSRPGCSISVPMREKALENPPSVRCSSKSLMLPDVGVTSPAIIFMVVDLPAPFFPTKP